MPSDPLASARDRFVTIGTQKLHYRDVGDPAAPPVVMLHGIMGHAREWDVLVGALAGDHRMIVLDQRGHGESDWSDDYTASALADDLLGLIGHVGLLRTSVIGHSMGGMAALLAAERRPEVVDRLVVVDVGPDIVSKGLAPGVAEFMTTLASRAYATVDEACAEWTDPLARPQLLRHYVVNCLRTRPDGRLVWRFDGAGLVRFLDSVSEAELWKAVDHIACPALVVRGAHSPVLSAETANAMVRRFADGRGAVIPDGAHDLGVERPEAVAAVTERFFADVATR